MKSKYEKRLDEMLLDPLIQAAVEETPQRGLESEAHFTARLKKQLHKSLHEYQRRIRAGIKFLETHHQWVENKRWQNAIHHLEDEKNWEKFGNQLNVPQEILGLTNDEMISFYQLGVEQFDKNHPETASHIFLLLTALNPKVGAYWYALGTAEEKRGEMESAMQSYLFASELEMRTLDPYLQGARCLLLFDKKEQARAVLLRALDRAEKEANLKNEKIKIEKILNNLK